MSLQRVPLNNFRGGLNVRDNPFELQANESPELQNVTVSNLVGQLETRKGKTRLDNTYVVPNEPVDFAKQVVIGNGARFLMMSINGAIWYMNPKGECGKLFAGTAGTVWDFELYSNASFEDRVYCGNGVDAMQKWDGKALTTAEWKAGKGEIPKGGVLCVWENRMFISYVSTNIQRVFFSEYGDPEAETKEYGYVDVRASEDDLDAIQDLAVLGARLYILKRRNVFYISSSVTMLNRHIGSPGVWSRFQCGVLEEKLYFFNEQGLFSTAGVTVTMESGSINNYFPQHLSLSYLEKVRLIITKDTYPRLLVAMPTDGSTTNNTLLEMVPHINFRRIGGRRYLLLPAFFLHTLPATALACWNPLATEEMIVGASEYIVEPVPEGGDTFNRAPEAPLSDGGKWKGILSEEAAKGEIYEQKGRKGLFVGPLASGLWMPNGEGASELVYGGAFAEVQYENPVFATAAEYKEAEGGTLPKLLLFANFNRAKKTSEQKGYYLEAAFNWENNTTYIELLKKEGSHKVRLAKTVVSGYPPYIGITTTGGRITAWIKYGPEELYYPALVAHDTAYTKGYVGFEAKKGNSELGSLLVNNFEQEVHQPESAVERFFIGENDNGIPINAMWHSAWLPIQEQEPKERIRRLNVELQGDAIVDVFTDFEEQPRFTATLPKAGEMGEFDEPTPGEEGSVAYRFARVRPETHGRYHAVRFRTDPKGDPFLINAAELAIRGGKEH